MVIHDLDIKSVAIPPYETDTVLIVDSNAVLPRAIAVESLKVIPWRHP